MSVNPPWMGGSAPALGSASGVNEQRMILTYIFVSLVGLYTSMAAVADIRLRRIPNFLTVPTALCGLAFHTFTPWGIWWSLAGFAVGFGLLFIPWLLGGSGMGDVKLLAALGAWLGPKYMLYAFVASIFLAGVMSLAVLTKVACFEGVMTTKRRYLSKGRSSSGPRKVQGSPPRKAMRVLPFAVPVALSTWIVLAWLTISKQGDLLH